MTTLVQAVAVSLPPQRSVLQTEIASAPQWRGVTEQPGASPGDMAIEAGRAALAATDRAENEVEWVVHTGSGLQAGIGWPMHHYVQHGIIGNHGNALEIKQYCAGGLSSWLVASGLLSGDGVSICTGADNWSWGDRFITSRMTGGEPFSDVAHAVVLSRHSGFASILGAGSASCPAQAEDWRTREYFWQETRLNDYRAAYARAIENRSESKSRQSVRMLGRALGDALNTASVTPEHVDFFIPHSSATGQPYKLLANAVGLPWSQSLYDYSLDCGYLGVSTQAQGLIYLIESGQLFPGAVVVMLASEYQLSATAIVVRIERVPVAIKSGRVTVVS